MQRTESSFCGTLFNFANTRTNIFAIGPLNAGKSRVVNTLLKKFGTTDEFKKLDMTIYYSKAKIQRDKKVWLLYILI